MKRVNVEGTLGDSFIVSCKLRKIRDRVIVHHYTKHIHTFGSISEIYKMMNTNVDVRFVIDPRRDLPEITSDSHEGEMEFFPQIKFSSDLGSVKKPYMILQPHSGKLEGYNSKKLPKYLVNELILNTLPKKTVLLGTHDEYSDISGCVNLIGKTSIEQATFLIRDADNFYGPEGLLSFIALSHQIPSLITYSSAEAVERRIVGTPWEKFATLRQM